MTMLAALVLMPQLGPAKVDWDAQHKVVQQQFAEWHPDRLKTAFDFAIRAPLPRAKGVWQRLCDDHKQIEAWYDKVSGTGEAEQAQIEAKRQAMYKDYKENDFW